jgi:hypothetical protein
MEEIDICPKEEKEDKTDRQATRFVSAVTKSSLTTTPWVAVIVAINNTSSRLFRLTSSFSPDHSSIPYRSGCTESPTNKVDFRMPF